MKAWLFDVDGVLTDPQEKKIVDQEIFLQLIRKLESNEPVGLNTGRSLEFINKEVLDPLEGLIEDKSILNLMFAVGEKGGVWMHYENEKRAEDFDPSLKPSPELEKEVKNLVENEFSSVMFFDDTKKTMISTEINKGASLQEYGRKQTELIEKITSLIREYEDLKIDKSIIAVDIEHEKMGKDAGVRKFLELAADKNIDPDEFTAFGDSKSDLAMIEELKKNGKKVIFVFVGNDLENQDVVKTSEKYYGGTLEYLKAH